jgi:hypothetical protein
MRHLNTRSSEAFLLPMVMLHTEVTLPKLGFSLLWKRRLREWTLPAASEIAILDSRYFGVSVCLRQ